MRYIFYEQRVVKILSSDDKYIYNSFLWCLVGSGLLQDETDISFPATGYQRLIEVDDECKLHTFCEKPMATEVTAHILGGRVMWS